MVWDLTSHGQEQPVRVWMNVGRLEGLLEPNRRFHQHLLSRGYEVSYQECNAGHNYTAWRNDVWQGLELMFGLRQAAMRSEA